MTNGIIINTPTTSKTTKCISLKEKKTTPITRTKNLKRKTDIDKTNIAC